MSLSIRRGIAFLGVLMAVSVSRTMAVGAADLHVIKHVVIIMQENRSFDSYFGTYPGADGIPFSNGVPTACVPDPVNHTCLRPYHDANAVNHGGPHDAAAAAAAPPG
jgi:phospholipase C